MDASITFLHNLFADEKRVKVELITRLKDRDFQQFVLSMRMIAHLEGNARI
jgi:hypothetical protein